MIDKKLQCHPLTEARWHDFEQLFGKNGACGGCWCMLWRLPRKQFDSQKGDGNRKAMKAIVASGASPGLLGYLDGRPVGWCAVAPRENYLALRASEKNNSTSCLSVGPPPALHPPPHIPICADECAWVSNQNPAPYCGIIYCRDPKSLARAHTCR